MELGHPTETLNTRPDGVGRTSMPVIPTWTGLVSSIHTAPRSFLPMKAVSTATLVPGVGMKGDRYANGEGFYSVAGSKYPGQQLTLFESETLEALARDHDITLSAADHRRNITTEGVPLNHLVGRRFWVGEALLEGSRLCTPCRHIEQLTGKEIFSLLLNRGGLNAVIVRGGDIRVGDRISPVEE